MAIAYVQKVTAESANYDSTTLAFPSNVVSGNLLLCCGAVWDGSAITSIPISDTVGTSYTTLLGTVVGGGQSILAWVAYGIAAGSGANTVTINPNGGGRYSSQTLIEFSGIDATPLDVNGGNSTGTSTSASDSITTTAADTVVVGIMTHGSTSAQFLTPDTGGGWVEAGEVQSTTNAPHNVVYQIFASAGSKTPSWTIGNSVTWCAMTASFEATAAAATNVHRTLMLGVGI